MNNFNTVFTVVKKRCLEKETVSGGEQFQMIASEIGISLERLHFYLDCLEQTGVIQYSPQKKSITLTKKGISVEKVFP